MDAPFFSVIMPTYNSMKHGLLESSIKSVLNQTCGDWELIIVDDGSTDGTVAYAEKFLWDPRVRVIGGRKNTGMAAARNAGASVARGEWLAFIDHDDQWRAEKLQQCRDFINELPCELVIHGIQVGDLHIFPYSLTMLRDILFEHSLFAPSAVVVRKNEFEHLSGFDEDADYAADWDLCVRFAANYRVGVLQEVLSVYSVHDSMASLNLKKMIRCMVYVVEKSKSYIGHSDFAKLKMRHVEKSVRMFFGVRDFSSVVDVCMEAQTWRGLSPGVLLRFFSSLLLLGLSTNGWLRSILGRMGFNMFGRQ